MGAYLFFGVIASLVALGLLVWLLITIFQEGPKPQDFTIVENFMPQHTNGFSSGILLEVRKGSKRDGYVFVPKDIDYYGRRKVKNRSAITPQIIYVEKDKVISFPRGVFSAERNKVWLLPPTPEALPEELKRTDLGRSLILMINERNAIKTEVESIREGAERIKDIYKRQGDGEISSEELKRLDSMHDSLVKQSAKSDEKKTSLNLTGGSSL